MENTNDWNPGLISDMSLRSMPLSGWRNKSYNSTYMTYLKMTNNTWINTAITRNNVFLAAWSCALSDSNTLRSWSTNRNSLGDLRPAHIYINHSSNNTDNIKIIPLDWQNNTSMPSLSLSMKGNSPSTACAAFLSEGANDCPVFKIFNLGYIESCISS